MGAPETEAASKSKIYQLFVTKVLPKFDLKASFVKMHIDEHDDPQTGIRMTTGNIIFEFDSHDSAKLAQEK